MNHLTGRPHLVNRYFAMRHGHSRPNAAGRVVSDPAAGRLDSAGLSGRGREEVGRAITAITAATGATPATAGAGGGSIRARIPGDLGPSTCVVCSDFSRARETASIVCAGLGAAPAQLDRRLRERFFGELEGGPDVAYAIAWTADAAGGSGSRLRGVERPDEVLDRTTALVAELEERYAAATVLLISHGDVLQILQCGFAGLDPGRHRALAPLATAEIRELTRRAPQ